MNSDQKKPENLSEDDIKILFGSGPAPIQAPLPPVVEFKPEPTLEIERFNWGAGFLKIAKIIGIFAFIFVISFTVLNFPALWLKLQYYWKVDRNKQTWTTQNQKFPPLATVSNHLVIPKIGVDAPIGWNISDDDTLNSLEKGVAHYQGTALPGETGNVFITGHSSYYLWSGGSYKQIFALLDKLQTGDRIYVNYNNTIFAYEVTSKVVVSPDNLSVLNQGDQKTLSLMTCVPVGTNLNRLVVSAKQITL